MEKNDRVNLRLSIRSMLLFLMVILFFEGVIIAYYKMLYSETRNAIITSGELSAVTSAEQIDQYLSKGVNTMKLASYSLDNMIRAGESQEDIKAFLVNQTAAIINTTSENSTGMYGYINGEYLDGTEWVPDDDYVATERPWYIDARANVGRVAVVDPYIDAQTNTVMITFSKTLCDAKSVAAMDFSLDVLQDIAEEISARGDSDMEIVLDRKYQVIAHSDRSQVGKNYMSEEGTFGRALVNELRTSDEGFYSLNYNDAEYIVYAVSVSNDWICLSVSDATSAFSRLKNMLLITFIASLLVVSILLIIMILTIEKQLEVARLNVHTEKLNEEVAKQSAVAEERGKKIEQMSFQTIQTLAHAIDAKDPYTKGHSTRVSQYSVLLAEALGWDQERINDLKYAALLHDIGMTGVQDSIINNPKKLTEAEIEIIRSHTTIGTDVLKSRIMIEAAFDVAGSHHERYDGKGYPKGLSGEDISEEARIVAIADAFDAMNSDRVYRKACTDEYIKHELEKNRGKQFDPDFVGIFIDLWERGLLDDVINSKDDETKIDIEGSSALLQDIFETYVSQNSADEIDMTTGIKNRNAGEPVIAHIMQDTPGCLMLLDMDNLKKINDTYGHEAGDKALKLIGDTLKEHSKDGLCCRLGGDEFLLYVKNVSSNEAEQAILAIKDTFDSLKGNDAEIAPASISAGLVMNTTMETYAEVFNQADKALYHVKQNGKNGYSFYNSDESLSDLDSLDHAKLIEGIRNSGNYKGALDVEYRQFVKLYEYISNLGKRFSHSFKMIIISLDVPKDKENLSDDLERDMFYMDKAIRQNVRSVDIITRYGRKQFLIIMIETDHEGIKNAVDRIFDSYQKMNENCTFSPSYNIADIED